MKAWGWVTEGEKVAGVKHALGEQMRMNLLAANIGSAFVWVALLWIGGWIAILGISVLYLLWKVAALNLAGRRSEAESVT